MATNKKTDELLQYILSLSPEQESKIFNLLPQLSALLDEPTLPYLQEPYLQTG